MPNQNVNEFLAGALHPNKLFSSGVLELYRGAWG